METERSAALAEIRKQLWLGHASVMIGSGFSRNADRASTSIGLPPDWGELASMFVDQLYVDCSADVKARVIQQKSVLQLAQEFESAFQRSGLNQFLKEKIADYNLRPNSLFSRLLELPWNNVFTTNYDTLLERAAQSVMHQKYDVVYSCKDLAFSDPPRIIKLHGSFPSEATPLIVTEEDYRTYPKKFSPFVNTVQQTLMENILCLIGFSGSDPNFLQWIGWVRDNLGETMPSIYLIGCMDFTSAERRVLEGKRIIPVDLSTLRRSSSGGYVDAIKRLFDFLEKKPSSIDWKPDGMREWQISDEALIAQIQELSSNRESYPNWIVLPWQKCDNLFSTTEFLARDISRLEALPSPWDLNGLFELTWRMEKALMPIQNELIPFYRKTLEKYNPIKHSSTNRDIAIKWRYLAFAIYRWCREEMQKELRQQFDDLLEQVCQDDNADMNHLCYERVMWALALPDIQKIDESMLAWSQVSRTPFWNVRYASLLCELGKTEEAVAIFEQTISQIRPNIPKGRIKSDYHLLNLEGIILSILPAASFEIQLRKGGKADTKSHHLYYQRLEELAAINCNPNEILDRYRVLMEANEKQDFGYSTKREFDRVSKSFKQVFGWPKELKNGYQVARLIEDICMPIYIGNVNTDLTRAVPGCVSRLIGASSGWAFSLLIRTGVTEQISVEGFFSQRKVASIPSDQADGLIHQYVGEIAYVLEEHSEQLTLAANGLYRRMVGTMFEVVSRLTEKASQTALENILDLVLRIVKRELLHYDIIFKGFYDSFVPRLMRAMAPATVFKRLADVLILGTPPSPEHRRFWFNPLYDVNWRGLSKNPANCSAKVRQILETSLNLLDSDDIIERTAALTQLNTCLDLGICSKGQKYRIAKTLCHHSSKSGLPIVRDYLSHAFLSLLNPIKRRTAIEHAIRKSYLEFDFLAFTEKDIQNKTCSGTPRIQYFSRSILATSSTVAPRTQTTVDLSIEDIHLLQKRLQTGFETSKGFADTSRALPFPIGEGLKSRFAAEVISYDRILGEVIIPRLSQMDMTIIMKWLEKWGDEEWMPCARIPTLFGKKVLPKRFIEDLTVSFASMSINRFQSSAHALCNWCTFAEQQKMKAPPPELMSGFVSVIGMRNDDAVKIACDMLSLVFGSYVFSNEMKHVLYQYVGQMASDTEFSNPSPRFENDSRHDFRMSAAHLANRIYLALCKNGMSIPHEVLIWKEICSSNNELSSIRRIWREI